MSTKKEEFKQLPRPFKHFQLAKPDVMRPAPALSELPNVLIPSNDRRIPFPPLVNYGYAVSIERMDEILGQKLDCPPGMLGANPFDLLIYLQHDVLQYGVKFKAVYYDVSEMFFLAISSNWKPAPSNAVKEVVKKLKDFLEVDTEPVWCLDATDSYWKK